MTAATKQRIDDAKNGKKKRARAAADAGEDGGHAPRGVADRFKSPCVGGADDAKRSRGAPAEPEEEVRAR